MNEMHHANTDANEENQKEFDLTERKEGRMNHARNFLSAEKYIPFCLEQTKRIRFNFNNWRE